MRSSPAPDRRALARLGLWAGFVLALAIATFLGATLDRCDPRGNLIAFLSYRAGHDGLYAVDADRGTLCRLSLAGGGGSIGSNHSAWSPAGDALAWIDGNRLLLQRLSDPAPTALTEYVTGSEKPMAWSPDGTRIALIATSFDAVSRLVIVELSDPPALREIAVLERLPLHAPDPPRSQLIGSRFAWSPDGRQLLLDRGDQILRFDLINASADLLLAPGRQPAWSPDGAQIAFVRAGALMVARADGTAAREVAVDGEHPVWSPDGTWIAFRTAEGVALVHPDGAGERLLARGAITPINDSNATSYTWSPDGHYLAVLEGDWQHGLPGTNAISVVRVADGQMRRLINRGVNRAPAWRPAMPAGESRKAGGR